MIVNCEIIMKKHPKHSRNEIIFYFFFEITTKTVALLNEIIFFMPFNYGGI